MNNRAILLECLIDIWDNGPRKESEGICENADIIWNDNYGHSSAYHLIPVIAVGWPKHSGNVGYPIPSTDKDYDAEDCFDVKDDKWEGEQGKLRKELINYMIKQLEGDNL